MAVAATDADCDRHERHQPNPQDTAAPPMFGGTALQDPLPHDRTYPGTDAWLAHHPSILVRASRQAPQGLLVPWRGGTGEIGEEDSEAWIAHKMPVGA